MTANILGITSFSFGSTWAPIVRILKRAASIACHSPVLDVDSSRSIIEKERARQAVAPRTEQQSLSVSPMLCLNWRKSSLSCPVKLSTFSGYRKCLMTTSTKREITSTNGRHDGSSRNPPFFKPTASFHQKLSVMETTSRSSYAEQSRIASTIGMKSAGCCSMSWAYHSPASTNSLQYPRTVSVSSSCAA